MCVYCACNKASFSVDRTDHGIRHYLNRFGQIYGFHFFRFFIFREKRRIFGDFSRKTKKTRKKIICKITDCISGTKRATENLNTPN